MKTTLLVLAVAAASTVANAGLISSTGFGTYTYTSPGSGSGTAVDVTSNPGWLNATGALPGSPFGTAGADWISTSSTANGVDGLYTYSTTFSAGAVGTPFTISGQWATDNCGEILVNGTDSGVGLGGGLSDGTCNSQLNYSVVTPFTVSGLSNGGTNTITFEIFNVNSTPQGVLVDTSAPEPSSVLSVLTGLGLAGAGLYRRKVRSN